MNPIKLITVRAKTRKKGEEILLKKGISISNVNLFSNVSFHTEFDS